MYLAGRMRGRQPLTTLLQKYETVLPPLSLSIGDNGKGVHFAAHRNNETTRFRETTSDAIEIATVILGCVHNGLRRLFEEDEMGGQVNFV